MRKYNKGDLIIRKMQVLDIFGGEGKSRNGCCISCNRQKTRVAFCSKNLSRRDTDSIKRFFCEAETWITIGIHPNIVKANSQKK